MAIAPLTDPEELEIPWPRPVLILLTEGRPSAGATGPGRGAVAPDLPLPRPLIPVVRTGTEVAERRRVRASARVRRRRLALALLVTALVVGLALPSGILGGHGAGGAASDLPGAILGGRGVEYVVQPHDTIDSIARTVDPTDPGPLEALLVRQTGSPTLTQGEHLTLP